VIRVLLVHDTRLLRLGLAALLGRESDLTVSTASWGDAGSAARALRPHVSVVDVECPGSTALAEDTARAAVPPGATTTAAGSPLSNLLVLAPAAKPGLLRRASEAKALGYVNKDGSAEGLLHAIRQVAAGERFVDATLGFGFLQAAEMPLTPREFSVLSIAAEGASIGEIARRLHLSDGTVRNYMATINRKTGARNRVDAIRISRGAGWL
jgi:two-component system, NarL family, response regulator DesR